MSIQPIYYSINEEMCKNILKPMTKNLINEIPQYGPECSEVAASTNIRGNSLINIQNLEQGIEVATEAIVWVCFILILFITAMLAFRCWANRNTAIADKRAILSQTIQANNRGESGGVPTEVPMFSDREEKKEPNRE